MMLFRRTVVNRAALPPSLLVLTMTPNGGALAEAVRMLGYTPYLFETTIRKGNLQTHPKEWCMVLNREKKFDPSILEIGSVPTSPEATEEDEKQGNGSSVPQLSRAYDALVGPPATLAYEAILHECPRATKVILVEEPDKLTWEKEYEILLGPTLEQSRRLRRTVALGDLYSMLEIMTNLRKATSAKATRGFSQNKAAPVPLAPWMRLASALDLFEAHVKEVVPRDRLLVYRVGEGWGPLCAFLRLPVPTTTDGEPSPFPPHTNGVEAFCDLGEKLHRITIFVTVLLIVALTSLFALLSSVRTRMALFMRRYYDRFQEEMEPFLNSDGHKDDSEGSKVSLRRKVIEAKKATLKFENEIRDEGGAMNSVTDVLRALLDPEQVVKERKSEKMNHHMGKTDTVDQHVPKCG